jgi:hypothetical protein
MTKGFEKGRRPPFKAEEDVLHIALICLEMRK